MPAEHGAFGPHVRISVSLSFMRDTVMDKLFQERGTLVKPEEMVVQDGKIYCATVILKKNAPESCASYRQSSIVLISRLARDLGPRRLEFGQVYREP